MLLHEQLTYNILGAFFAVHSTLGSGLLEAVYTKAMLIELRHRGLRVDAEVPLTVRYRGEIVGEYRADIIVERTVLLELKAVDSLSAGHEAQLLNYLKISGRPVGLLLNFGPRAERRRLILTARGGRLEDLTVMRPPQPAIPATP